MTEYRQLQFYELAHSNLIHHLPSSLPHQSRCRLTSDILSKWFLYLTCVIAPISLFSRYLHLVLIIPEYSWLHHDMIRRRWWQCYFALLSLIISSANLSLKSYIRLPKWKLWLLPPTKEVVLIIDTFLDQEKKNSGRKRVNCIWIRSSGTLLRMRCIGSSDKESIIMWSSRSCSKDKFLINWRSLLSRKIVSLSTCDCLLLRLFLRTFFFF